MKIQIVIVGWYFENFNNEINLNFIEDLKILENKNLLVNVFWACHKEPTDWIKNSFDYKVFKNVGLEWGAYDQALNHLGIEKDTIYFFFQDDIIVLDWDFLPMCVDEITSLNSSIIGNGFNYTGTLDPSSKAEFYNGKYIWKELIKPENQYLYDEVLTNFLSIRGSFLCTGGYQLMKMNGFEYVDLPFNPDMEDGEIDGLGNGGLYLNSYKFNKLFGPDEIKYMSNRYRRSRYMIECVRGMEIHHNEDYTEYPIPQKHILTTEK